MTHSELSAAGYVLTDSAYGRVSAFVHALLAENQKLNLTSLRNEVDIWSVHACDSLSVLAAIRQQGTRRLLDLGTGGGLPGVPLACACPELSVTLLDATRKKVKAVERIIAAVGLTNVRCVWGRAETLVHEADMRAAFDGVTARAVAALPLLVGLAAGFAAVGGTCWFFKTPSALIEEVPAAAFAAKRCGLRQASVWNYMLPSGHGERSLIAYKKVTSPHDTKSLPPRGVARRSGGRVDR